MITKLLDSIYTDQADIIISDNGNFLTETFKKNYPHVVILHLTDPIPMFSNWNNAISCVETPYMMIPSDDDLFLEDTFSTIHSYIDKFPDVDAFIFGHHCIDDTGNIMYTWKPESEMIFLPPLGFDIFKFGVAARMPSIVFRSEIIKSLHGFDESYKITAADSDLIQQVLLQGKTMFVPTVISCYRMWRGNLTSQKQASAEWLDEIRYWTKKIAPIAEQKFNQQGISFNSAQYCDEIFALNLLAGMRILRSQSDKLKTRLFFREQGLPRHATLKTKIKLLKAFIRTYF